MTTNWSSPVTSAFRSLVNELSGFLSVYSLDMRHAAGNTNVQVLQDKLDAARLALGTNPAATPARPTDAELLGVLNAARIALKSRDQSSFEMKVLDGLKVAIALLENAALAAPQAQEGEPWPIDNPLARYSVEQLSFEIAKRTLVSRPLRGTP